MKFTFIYCGIYFCSVSGQVRWQIILDGCFCKRFNSNQRNATYSHSSFARLARCFMIQRYRLVVPFAAAVAGSAFAAGISADELNIYSARHYDSDQILYQAFTDETGIRINVLEGDSDQLIERMQREGVASPADVMLTVDAGRLWRAEQDGLFQGIESDILNERLPESMRHPEGKWFGFSQRARVIFYNPENVDPGEITSYEDLADPRWQGEVCIRSSNNIYNQS